MSVDTKKIIAYGEITVLLLLAGALLLSRLYDGSIASFDEAIYAQVGKERLENGDVVTLRYAGEPWFHKPPLLFYLLAGLFKIAGISTLTMRLLPALFGVATVILVYFLGKKIYGHVSGFFAALILLTSELFVQQSRMLMLDTPLVFFVVLSFFCFCKAQEKNGYYLLFGAALGLGFMTKSVVALLPLIAVILFYLITSRSSKIFEKPMRRTLVIVLLIILPWHLAQITLHGMAFINQYVGYHLFKRIVDVVENNSFGPFFYFKILRYGFAPWVFVLLPAFIALLIQNLRSHHNNSSHSTPSLSWLIIIWALLFFPFLLIKTNLPWYILPVFPAFALIVGNVFAQWRVKKIPIGTFVFIPLLFLSLKIPTVLECNHGLEYISQAYGPRALVHDSVSAIWGGEVFFLGTDRYTSAEILVASKMLYVIASRNFDDLLNAGYRAIYFEDDLFVLSKTLAHVQPEQKSVSNRKQCYRFLPHNLK